jgi:3-deoxy-D-manno-octulosonate 8-phosphate phosphatase (KDO 8-P phosphatase)
MALTDIKLLVLDVDGVLTDGRLYYGPGGEELKAFDVRDGAGIKLLEAAGVETAILSGRESEALRRRMEDLGISLAVTGSGDKAAGLRELAAARRLKPEEIGYVGDDLMDLPAMRLAGWSACPADAVAEIRAAAAHVTAANGGRGAVREVAEHLLKARGSWDAVLRDFGGS